MASATKGKVTQIVTAQKLVDVVNLELSLDEAKVVLDLTQNCSGNAEKSRRGLTNKVGDALQKAGVTPTGYPIDYTGSINFKSPPGPTYPQAYINVVYGDAAMKSPITATLTTRTTF